MFLGILLPDLAALLRPLVIPAVIATLASALLRLDWSRLLAYARRPWFALLLAVWQLLLSPLLVWFGAKFFGLPPSLGFVLTLQAAAPPIGSAAVFALLLGLDASLTVLGTVITILLLPLSLTPLMALLTGTRMEIDLLAFFLRVTLMVLTPFVLAGLLRRLVGIAFLQRHARLLDGLNVVLLVVFAIGVMDGVTAHLLSDPEFIATLLFAACAVTLLLHIAGFLAFRWAGALSAYSAAICSGNRNMGLMLAVTSGLAGAEFSLYVGLAQIPMYFAPLLLAPLVRRSFRAHRPPLP